MKPDQLEKLLKSLSEYNNSEVILARNATRDKLKKFVKIQKLTDRNMKKALSIYLEHKFGNCPFDSKTSKVNLIIIEDDDSVCLFFKGREVYRGTVTYLKRYYTQNLIHLQCNRILETRQRDIDKSKQ